MSILLSVNSISVFKKDKPLLKEVSFEVIFSQNLAIIGETGSSKTTLLKAMSGLLEVDAGEVRFQNEKVKGPSRRLVPGHPQIKYLAQQFELPKFITVSDYLDRSSEVKVENPDEIYQACNITHLLERDTMALSGGERQRVALAKEILKAPSILLLDEPFSNLDFSHRQELHSVLRTIKKDLSVTTVLVAHDPKDVLAWAENIVVMRSGKVVQTGSPSNIYNQPLNTYVAGLLGVYSIIDTNDLEMDQTPGKVDQIILRPHHIQLTSPKKGKKAVIEAVHYVGSYDQVMLRFKKQKIHTVSEVGSYRVGDEVGFEIKS